MRSLFCLLFLLPFPGLAQFQTEEISGPVPWTSLEANDSDESFQFAIVTDRTGHHRPGVFEDAVRKLNLLQPEFVITVGDLIEGYTEDRDVIAAEWDEFNSFIANLKMPFFYLPGNHDYSNEVMAKEWKKRFGPDYYHFIYKDVLFLCLNSSGDMPRQLKYIREVLEDNQDVKWTFVFIHHPLFTYPLQPEWEAIEKELVGRNHTVFAGHNHRYVKYERNEANYVILATTGGGSPLRGDQFGEFDHVVWMTMTEDGPIIANLKLNGILDQNISTEESKMIVDKMHFGEMLKIDPLYTDGDKFEGGKSRLKITNSADIAASVELSASSSPYMTSSLSTMHIDLPPNSVEMVDIDLLANVSCNSSDVTPIKLTSGFTYEIIEGNPVTFENSVNIKPARRHPLKEITGINIDGNLEDWEGIDFHSDQQKYVNADVFSHNGEEDASFEFATAISGENLTLAIRVTDDDIISHKNTEPFKQDGIGVLIDARRSSLSAYTTKHAIFTQVMYFGFSPAKDQKGNPYIFEKEKLPPKSKVKYSRTANGWNAELALPIEYIKELQGEDWQTARINVYMTDLDKEGIHFTEILWKPDWRKPGTYSGSGMFRKQL